jgi:hypothetical protein
MPSGYIIDGEFLERLSDYQMLKEVPALYRLFDLSGVLMV